MVTGCRDCDSPYHYRCPECLACRAPITAPASFCVPCIQSGEADAYVERRDREDRSTLTVDAAAGHARALAEANGDDHGPACRCPACVEDLR